jgi:hypothetical protein
MKIIVLAVITVACFTPSTNLWKILSTTTARFYYDKQAGDFRIKYHFPRAVKKLEGNTVEIAGYLEEGIPFSTTKSKFLLSLRSEPYPTHSCFLPEMTEYIEIQHLDSFVLKPKTLYTFRGKFHLNKKPAAFTQSPFFLTKARCLEGT